MFTTGDLVFGLTTRKASRDFSMLLLTFVTSAGGFAFAGGGSSPSSDAFVVCAFGVGQGA